AAHEPKRERSQQALGQDTEQGPPRRHPEGVLRGDQDRGDFDRPVREESERPHSQRRQPTARTEGSRFLERRVLGGFAHERIMPPSVPTGPPPAGGTGRSTRSCAPPPNRRHARAASPVPY